MRKLTSIFLLVIFTLSSYNSILASEEKKISKTFNVAKGGDLYLKTDKGSIKILTHNSESITVDVHLKAKTNDEELAEKLFENFKIDFDHNGDDLNIEAKYRGSKNWISNIFGSSKWNKLKVKFIITVPNNYNVDLNTSGGGISVDDLVGKVIAGTSGGGLTFGNIDGSISGRTSGGGITVGECSGNIDINTSGGGIKIKKCKGKVEAHTSGGGITVNEVYGPINASTSGGSVYASILEQPREDCYLSTSGGGVTVKLASDININLDARTSGGSVKTDFPITVKGKIQRSKLKGVINDGGPLLELRSSGGSIYVEEG